MAYSFGVADVLAALGVTAADFEIQGYDPGDQGDEASVTTRLGAIAAGSILATNRRREATLTLKSKVAAGATVPTFSIGGAGTGASEPKIVIIGASAKQVFNDYATLTVRVHSHPDSATNGHVATPAAVAITVPALGYGILDGVCVDDVGDDPAENLQSVEQTWEAVHVDKTGRLNAFLVGATTGVKESCTVEYVDNGTALTISTGWVDALTGNNPESNADFKMKSVKAVKQAA